MAVPGKNIFQLRMEAAQAQANGAATAKTASQVNTPAMPKTTGVTPPLNPQPSSQVNMNPGKTSPVPQPNMNPGRPGVTPQKSTPQVFNAATNTGGVVPNLGYGGATYGANRESNAAILANSNALKNTPGFKDSEIQRTLGVIEARKDQGLDVSAQEKYLTKNLGYVYPAMPEVKPDVSLSSGNIPGTTGTDAVYNTRTSQDLQQYANDQNAIERAALLNAINTQKQSLRNSAQYSQQLLNDSRTLENLQMDRTLNPFSGRTSYDKAMVNRGRGIDDSSRAAELTNLLNSYDTELANFDKLAPERARQIYNELLAAERQFGLQQGSLTGNYGGGRTLAGQQTDWGQLMDLANQTGYLPNSAGASGNAGAGQSAGFAALSGMSGARTLQGIASDRQGQQMNIDNALAYGDRAGMILSPQTDPSGYIRQIQNGNAPLTFEAQQQNVQNNQWQQNFDRGKYESDRNYQYQVQQDSIRNGQWQQQFQMDVDRMGFQQASELWSQAFQADRAQQEQAQNQFNQGMAIFEQTGTMPDYMSQYGIDTTGFKDEAIKADLIAMYQALSTKQMTPQQALKQIDDQVAIGAEDKASGDKLKAAIYKLHPELDPSKKKTGGGNNSALRATSETVGWLTNPYGKLFTNYFSGAVDNMRDKIFGEGK